MISMSQMLEAAAYAQDMIKKKQCNDLDIRKKICEDICKKSQSDCDSCNNGIQWNANNRLQKWNNIPPNFPPNTKICTNDTECNPGYKCIPDPDDGGKLKCGFKTDDGVCGDCEIINEKTCNNLSRDMYNCTVDNDFINDCPTDDTAVYSEWHPDNTPLGGSCVLGNPFLKKWAEFPKTRQGADLQSVVPPFKYDTDNSSMYITPEYCNYFGLEYGTGRCTTDADCGNGKACVSTLSGKVCTSKTSKTGEISCTANTDCPGGTKCLDNICIGNTSDCYSTTGQDIAKFLVGNTIFTLFEDPPVIGDCVQKEFFPNTVKEMYEQFNKIPKSTEKIADSRYISQKKVLLKNIAGPGITLYAFQLKNEEEPSIGFLYDEVVRFYPQLCKINSRGIKVINVSKNQITDNNIKKIYVYSNSEDWLTKMLNLKL